MKDGYYGYDGRPDLSEWFDKHKFCGGSYDHFAIEYQHNENYDLGADWETIIAMKLGDLHG